MMTDHDVLVSVSAWGSQGESGGRVQGGGWGGEGGPLPGGRGREERERVSPDGLRAVCIGQVNPPNRCNA